MNSDQAWNLLKSDGYTTDQRMSIKDAFADIYREEYPCILQEQTFKSKIFKSTYKDIDHLVFTTEQEVILVNAMYVNLMNNDSFNRNDFIHQIKAIFRILNIKSVWAL